MHELRTMRFSAKNAGGTETPGDYGKMSFRTALSGSDLPKKITASPRDAGGVRSSFGTTD